MNYYNLLSWDCVLNNNMKLVAVKHWWIQLDPNAMEYGFILHFTLYLLLNFYLECFYQYSSFEGTKEYF